MRNLARAALSLGLLLGIAPARAADPTTVFAAASLKNAAVSAPARQIEQGAPVDLERMEYLAARELIRPETRVNLLNNRLVAVVPRAAPAIAAAAKMTARSIDRDIVSPDLGCVSI